MARDGSGGYDLPSGNPVITGTTISSTVHNNTMSDIATEIANSTDKDGQTVITAAWDFNGNEIILDADGDTSITADTDDQVDVKVGGTDRGAFKTTQFEYNKIVATGDTSAGDQAAMGYTATEGLVLTGQGSTYDVTIKNDADATVMSVPTGTTTAQFSGTINGQIMQPQSGSFTGALRLGANSNSTSLTNATAKIGRIATPHYDSDTEEDIFVLGVSSNGSINDIFYGGSAGVLNAATTHYFYAANTDTTVTGTLILTLGTQAGIFGVDVDPDVTETRDLGSASKEWDNIFLQNAATVSDERTKINQGTIDPSQAHNFLLSLDPTWFVKKDKTVNKETKYTDENGETKTRTETVEIKHSRPHSGFMAQQVKQAMTDAGIEDWCGYFYDQEADIHGLRPNEFIAFLVKGYQHLASEIESLK